MPPLSRQLFVLLSSLVEERSGLHYSDEDNALFSDKLWSRLAEAGFESPLDYYYFLRYDPAGEAELGALVDVLVVGETYLFRERDALCAVIDHVIRPAIEQRGRARVWSAGCSTGEEPFSLAMMLADGNLLEHVDIVATDVSHRSLARARAGTVTARSLRSFGPTATTDAPSWARRLVERWVEPTENGGGRVARHVVDRIDFRRDNLLDPKVDSLRDLDLILCRNVLIYFRDDVVRSVVTMFAERLRTGGRLVVGASESLLRFGTFLRCEERAGAFFYAKGAQ
jgi:chemotaxis protein methyltransferase CheR